MRHPNIPCPSHPFSPLPPLFHPRDCITSRLNTAQTTHRHQKATSDRDNSTPASSAAQHKSLSLARPLDSKVSDRANDAVAEPQQRRRQRQQQRQQQESPPNSRQSAAADALQPPLAVFGARCAPRRYVSCSFSLSLSLSPECGCCGKLLQRMREGSYRWGFAIGETAEMELRGETHSCFNDWE